MINLFIVGSCVTRDAFDKKFTLDEFNIAQYAARTSLARLSFEKVNVSDSEINLKSGFQKRVVAKAVCGNLLDDINAQDFDYLIVDIVDDRFGLVQFSENIFVTNSSELQASKFIKNAEKIKISPNTANYFTAWEKGLIKLLTVIPANKIIINDVLWAHKTDMGKSLSNPEKLKLRYDMAQQLYSIAKEHIPEKNFIGYDPEIFIGAEQHKWGKSPVHYVDDVYRHFVMRLKEITKK